MALSKESTSRNSPTIDDIADLCGLAKSTVSKALNGRSHLVADSTRQRVLEVARSVGFTPSWRARSLAQRRSQAIAVLNSAQKGSIPRGLYADICDHLDDRLNEHGYTMTFIHARRANARLEQMLCEARFDGVLTLGLIDPSILTLVRRQRMPAVLINPAADETWDRVTFDDTGGTMQAMNHLLSLGHQRIVFQAVVRLDHPCWPGRYGTYHRCMTDAGLKPLAAHIGSASEFVDWLMDQAPSERPTAVIHIDCGSAMDVMQALWRRGLRVPQDISIATFNDTHPAAELIPPLTTLAIPSRQIADTATRMILQRIESPEMAPQTVALPEQLVVRESTSMPGRACGPSNDAGTAVAAGGLNA